MLLTQTRTPAGDVSTVSRGGSALYGATAESPTIGGSFRHEKGGKTFVTTMPKELAAPAAAPLPFPVLWQVRSQEEDDLVRQYAMGTGGLDDSQIIFDKELRKLSQSRMERVMGRRESGRGIQNSAVEQSRQRVVNALEKARQRERVLQETAMLRAHTHDPGAETRPVPKVPALA